MQATLETRPSVRRCAVTGALGLALLGRGTARGERRHRRERRDRRDQAGRPVRRVPVLRPEGQVVGVRGHGRAEGPAVRQGHRPPGLRVAEEHRQGGFPLDRPEEDFDPERQERIGDAPSTFRDEGTRRFLRDADTAMGRVLRAHPRPLYITGPEPALSLFDEAGALAADAVLVPHGGLAHGTAEAVWQAVRPVLEDEARGQVEAVARELDAARGRKDFAAGVDELWESAHTGRVRLLAVEEGFKVTMRDDGEHLLPADDGDLDAREDIVDEIVEQCLETGADVRFVPDGALGDADGIAGVLRY
ncbi:hypothetical protein SVIOM342S_05588 [Streptomyces violaceorubidus]